MLQLASRIGGDHPVRRAEVPRLGTSDCLDRLGAAVHVVRNPWFPHLLLCTAQFHVAVRVVFKFVAALGQLLRSIDTCHADVFFVARLPPGLGSKPPADDKEGSLDAVLFQDIDQAWSDVAALAAEQHVGPGTVVEGKGNELAGRVSRAGVPGRKILGRDARRDTLGDKRRGTVRIGSAGRIVKPTTSAEYSETRN